MLVEFPTDVNFSQYQRLYQRGICKQTSPDEGGVGGGSSISRPLIGKAVSAVHTCYL